MNDNWGIVGIGKLGEAILTQFNHCNMPIGIYHPNIDKVTETTKSYPRTRILQKADLASLDFLILALPANNVIPFINDYHQSKGLTLQHTTLINMATSMPTEKLRKAFPDLTWTGMKFVGHSESLKRYGNGLFITAEEVVEKEEYQEVYQCFSKLGQVVVDKESIVEKINKLSTYHAIKVARELEQELGEQGLSDLFKEQALRSILPEVIRAYSKGNLGHFAQDVIKKLEQEEK
ncbi:NAD(P)-binding domain-containing protein [Salipaludibacillus sp. HK11]|uniref:NAD(P)-binding domain-containing protein n=1 Tax=Salipaludibacillus sp. HK11 TaxID=3394320 RepID=UPI0039FB9891